MTQPLFKMFSEFSKFIENNKQMTAKTFYISSLFEISYPIKKICTEHYNVFILNRNTKFMHFQSQTLTLEALAIFYIIKSIFKGMQEN